MDSQRFEGAVSVAISLAWVVGNNGHIGFSLTSTGLTHVQWAQYFECTGIPMSDQARRALLHVREAPTSGVIYNVVVLPGRSISDHDRMTRNIFAAGYTFRWGLLHWEVSCLIRDAFTDEQLGQMGVEHLVTMHEPINTLEGDPSLLSSDRRDGRRGLYAHHIRPESLWGNSGGFAFDASPVLSRQAGF